MSQKDIDRAVARATGERLSVIHNRGFSIADLADINFDPEPRSPLVFDWDSMAAADWPET